MRFVVLGCGLMLSASFVGAATDADPAGIDPVVEVARLDRSPGADAAATAAPIPEAGETSVADGRAPSLVGATDIGAGWQPVRIPSPTAGVDARRGLRASLSFSF